MAREKKLWAGRIKDQTASSVEAFTSSIAVDQKLYRYDIAGSIAHTKMLARQRIISAREAQRIVGGLKTIRKEIEGGDFPFSSADEDIHMNIERRLIHKIGPVAEKLHTARSRNDQVALDMRLYLREELKGILAAVRRLKAELARMARRYVKVIMPGYTHLQRAQPVLFSHHLLAYVDMLDRDGKRLEGCSERVNVLPLGSGALAGTTYPIDRAYVARLLGFPRLSKNSVDAVSDRDFVLEFLSVSAILFVHLSRLAEELILWSSEEFGFIELPDRYCTGSSMMPQKKNPDVPELIRAKTGRVYGHLQALLTVMKGLPLAYNRDLQEDKIPLFDTVDTVKASLEIMREVIREMRVKKERMLAAAQDGFMNATDLADYLVCCGMSFRSAHAVVGRIVRYCLESHRRIEQLSLAELRRFSARIEKDVYAYLTLDAVVERRRAPGGTAPANVRRRLREIGV
ncbi:MAG: argininosuccinate lyase [Candidatus Binatia bacterium]